MSDDLSAKGECIGGNNDERESSTNNQTSSDDYSKFSYCRVQGVPTVPTTSGAICEPFCEILRVLGVCKVILGRPKISMVKQEQIREIVK